MSLHYKYLWLCRISLWWFIVSILFMAHIAATASKPCNCTKEISDACKK